jgi:hypothetical protein
MPPPHTPSASNNPISISLGIKKKSGPSTASSLSSRPVSASPRLNLVAESSSSSSLSKKRPRSSLAESDSEDDASHAAAQPTLVSGFDHAAGGAIHLDGPREAKKALVIQGPKNKDWREESRRRRGGGEGEKLPHEVAAEKARNAKMVGDGEGDVLNNGPQAFGLTFLEKKIEESVSEDVVMVDAVVVTDEVVMKSTPPRPKTDDELAIEALTGDGKTRLSDLVLPVVGSQNIPFAGRVANGINEDDAFRTDIESRPDSSTLDDYAAVPVEEFGAALLRGMGWKEGDVVGKRKDQVSKARVVERRPALLGIGAKEVPGTAEELGAWGKSLMGKSKKGRKTQGIYTPVVLRDSATGEMVTEEELKERREGAKKGEEDWKERRDRNLEKDRERKGDRDGDIRSRRDRSRSPKRRRDLDDHRDRRHRDRDRDRDRDRERERGDRRRDRDSDHYDSSSSKHSRSDGDYRNGNRDRDRERDRERYREKDLRDEDRRKDGGDSRNGGSSRGYRINDGGRKRQESYSITS